MMEHWEKTKRDSYDTSKPLVERLHAAAEWQADINMVQSLICAGLAQLLRAQEAKKPRGRQEKLFAGEDDNHERAKRRTHIPDDWQPGAANRQLCAERGITGAALDRLVAEFVSYWQGVGKPRADWDATFRNRVVSARGSGTGRAGPGGQPRGGRSDQSLFGVTRDLIGTRAG